MLHILDNKVQKVYTILLTCLLFVSTPLAAQNLLDSPESVVFDSVRNRYIVSNWGDGAIVQIDSNGVQSYFSTVWLNQYQIAGLYLFGDTLLTATGVGNVPGLSGFDINTDSLLFHISIPGIGLPNDITVDTSGTIYVTDYWDDKLYRIVDHIPSIVIGHGQGLGSPNGIFYDEIYHRLLICSIMGPGAPILQLNLEDTTLSTLITGTPGYDGITLDNDRNLYGSDWNIDGIYIYDSTFTNPPQVFSTGHLDPADIYFDRINSLLCIPNFSRNTVDFVSIEPSAIGTNHGSLMPGKMTLFPIYPNPFNPQTQVTYLLPNAANVSLIVYDIQGRMVERIVDGWLPAGIYSAVFNGANLPSGTYIIQLASEGINRTQKIVLLK